MRARPFVFVFCGMILIIPVAGVIFLLLLGMVGSYLVSSSIPSSSELETKTQFTRSTQTPFVGDIFTFTDEQVLAGRTAADLDRLIQLSVAKDHDGVVAMAFNGTMVEINAGIRGKLIYRGWLRSEVRLMSGPSKGQSVWVANECLPGEYKYHP